MSWRSQAFAVDYVLVLDQEGVCVDRRSRGCIKLSNGHMRRCVKWCIRECVRGCVISGCVVLPCAIITHSSHHVKQKA